MNKFFCAMLMLYSINTFAANCTVNDSDISGEYSGGCKNGLAHGKGVAQGRDRYEGVFNNGIEHGKGYYSWADGRRYKGDWRNGKQNGKGIYTWSNGDRYEGEFLNDKMHGYGVYYFADGKRQEGEWQNNKLVSQVHNKHACDRLYAGKKVKASVSGLVNLFGIKNEDAIIIGLSKENGVATVQSINNSQMIGEVPCDELQ